MAYFQLGSKQFPLKAGSQRVGPDGTGADLVLPSGLPSATAVVVVNADQSVIIQRATPDSVVKVNSLLLGPEPSPLIHGDHVEIGGHDLRFGDTGQSGSTQFVSSADLAAIVKARGGLPAKPTMATGGRLVSLVDGREYAVPAAGLTIGRDPSVDVVVPTTEVSRKHVHIAPAEQGYLLTDLSTNGVWVNGGRVERQHVLGRGDVIKIASEEFRFYADLAKAAPAAAAPAAMAATPVIAAPVVQAPSPAPPSMAGSVAATILSPPPPPPAVSPPASPPAPPPAPPPPPPVQAAAAAPPAPAEPRSTPAGIPVAPRIIPPSTPPTAAPAQPSIPQAMPPLAPAPAAKPLAPAPAKPLAPAPAKPSAPRPALAHLEVINEGPDKGKRFDVLGPLTNIGRGGHNDLVLSNASVSDSHAKLQRRDAGWFIVDVESTNGTYVGGRRVKGEQALTGAPDLRFGDVKVAFRPTAETIDEGEATRAVVGLSGVLAKRVAERRAMEEAAGAPVPVAPSEAGRPSVVVPPAPAPTPTSGRTPAWLWVVIVLVVVAAAAGYYFFFRGA